jgi:hypothetical protein
VTKPNGRNSNLAQSSLLLYMGQAQLFSLLILGHDVLQPVLFWVKSLFAVHVYLSKSLFIRPLFFSLSLFALHDILFLYWALAILHSICLLGPRHFTFYFFIGPQP